MKLKHWLCALGLSLAILGCENDVETTIEPLPNIPTVPPGTEVKPEDPGAIPITGLVITLPEGTEDESGIRLELDETLQLGIEFTPGDATNTNVSWQSNETTIVTVSSTGLVTPVDAGTATISVFSKAVPTLNDTLTVTVIAHVAEVKLDKDTLEVYQYGAGSLTAILTPANATNKAVTWSSSNPAVAPVSGTGLTATVSGLTLGTTIITVTTAEGNFTDTATVTVTAPPAWPASHSLVVRNLVASPSASTTPDNPTLIHWDGDSWTGTQAINNAESSTSMGDSDPFKPRNSTLVYVDTPITGPFTMTTTLTFHGGGGSTGLFTGMFANPTPEATAADGFFHMIGFRQTNTGALRIMKTVEGDSINNGRLTPDVGGNPSEDDDYTYVIVWDGTDYSIKIYNSAGLLAGASTPATTTSAPLANAAAPHYPGFFLANTSITLKSFSVVSGMPTVNVIGVTLTPATLEIPAGQTGTLSAALIPVNADEQTVSWASSNEGIATVSGTGLSATVTGVTQGTATITVTTSDGGFTDTTEVTVTAPVPPTSISLNRDSLTMLAGASETLTATLSPEDSAPGVIWASSDESVATVSNDGVVTAVSVGTATITVTSVLAPTVSASAEVTVAAAPPWEGRAINKLVVRNLSDGVDSGTTADNEALIEWTGNTWTGTTVVTNAQSNAIMGHTSTSYHVPLNSTLVYLDTPIVGPYTFTAKITTTNGTSNDQGIVVGTFANPDTVANSDDDLLYIVGLRHARSGVVRRLHTNPSSSLRSDNDGFSTVTVGTTEYIYTQVWNGTQYTSTISDGSGVVATSTFVTGSANGNLHSQMVQATAPYYPGFFVTRDTATVTEITITTP
jgi:uncharacterized protein YjdB